MVRTARAAPRRLGFRWAIVALLFVLIILAHVDRAAMAYAIDAIAFEMDLQPDDFGLILGSFGLGYVVTTLIGGVAVDRWGARLVFFISTVVMVAALVMSAMSTERNALVAAQIVLGLAAGPLFPAVNRVIADWLSPHERGTALAYSLVAMPLAFAVSAPLLTVLMAIAGWRPMFWLLAIVLVVWIPFWVGFYQDDPARSRRMAADELEHIGYSVQSGQGRYAPLVAHGRHDWRFVLTNRTLLANAWAFFVFGYFLFFFMTWLPTYLHNAYNLSLDEIGLFSILPWLCGAVFLWGFGLLSDALLRRTGRLRIARSALIGWSQTAAALSVIPIIFASNIDMVVICIALAVGTSMAASTAFYATTIDIAPRRAGAALGVMYTAFAVSSFLAPFLTGRIVSITGSFDGAFALMAALALSSVVIVYLFHQPDETLRRANIFP